MFDINLFLTEIKIPRLVIITVVFLIKNKWCGYLVSTTAFWCDAQTNSCFNIVMICLLIRGFVYYIIVLNDVSTNNIILSWLSNTSSPGTARVSYHSQ